MNPEYYLIDFHDKPRNARITKMLSFAACAAPVEVL